MALPRNMRNSLGQIDVNGRENGMIGNVPIRIA